MLSVSAALNEIDSARITRRSSIAMQIKAGGQASSMVAAAARPAMGSFFGASNDTQQNQRQYSAFYGLQYAAIRPIAVRIAGQAIQVGQMSVNPEVNIDSRLKVKQSQLCCKGKVIDSPEFPYGISTRRMRLQERESMPMLAKSINHEDMEMVKNHPIYLDMREPNPHFTKSQLLYCVTASMCLTGKAIVLLEPRSPGRFTYWYIPSNWAEPIHREGQPFAKWRITPPGASEGYEVDHTEVIFFSIPDPANPLRSYSPTQAQSKPINTDDQIQESHYATLRNVINPKVVLRAGRIENPMTGKQDMLPVLTPEQRLQLFDAVKIAYAGAQKMGHPFIIDGLIEGIENFMSGPADLDYPNGSKSIEDRIMLGYGVSKTVAGQMEGANRATSYTAHQGVNDLVINPMITMISEVLTRDLGRIYRSPGTETAIWIEKAKAFDAELQLRRVQAGATAMTRGEMRRYMMTGEIQLEEREDDDELMPAPGTAKEEAADSQDDSEAESDDKKNPRKAA